MLRPASVMVLLLALAGPAEARFGKRSADGKSSSSASTEHAASGVASPSAVSTVRYAQAPPRPRYRSFGYGYGYSYWYAPPVVVAPAPVVVADEPAPAPVRVTVGLEGQGFIGGANLGVLATFEGERWGVSLSAADIIVRADDGGGGIDHIGDLTAHLTFAFLTGQYGRLRLEGGADAFFAPDAILVGPTVGLSGIVWLGGPVGIEGSVNVTPWPFTQVDARAGLAVGVENWGFRAGWRVQLLNDRGLVDGVTHQDVFNGPYLGVSYVF